MSSKFYIMYKFLYETSFEKFNTTFWFKLNVNRHDRCAIEMEMKFPQQLSIQTHQNQVSLNSLEWFGILNMQTDMTCPWVIMHFVQRMHNNCKQYNTMRHFKTTVTLSFQFFSHKFNLSFVSQSHKNIKFPCNISG